METQRTLRIVDRLAKFLLWARGGWKIHMGGPEWIGQAVTADYNPAGARSFDVGLMSRIYERPFEVAVTNPDGVPAEQDRPSELGGNLDGARIGFDLGASDYKLAAVLDGEAVFSTEIPWNPRDEADVSYHYEAINKGLKLAASKLPRVDAIGGSSAGVYVANRPMVASLFRSVPADEYDAKVKPLFERLRADWGVPLEVINDGDVTALAGGLSLKDNGVLGMAMGSSEAVGYLNREGRITGWLNELAFAPVDFNPSAEPDEWSGDRGVGALYFSQQAVNKLAPAAGLEFPGDMPLPERLKQVQSLMQDGDPRVAPLYETIGVYLGYTIPWYALFYDMRHVIILGRVTSGPGCEIILDTAHRILQQQFPDTAASLSLHVPDEEMKRVGQAVAAASLPRIL